ncbi:MAG: M4 family metallopeptidase [Gammaproteobacteria bacterium]|nr:M4 family metallopeptidase [Gammaproteobacteria bacterium]
MKRPISLGMAVVSGLCVLLVFAPVRYSASQTTGGEAAEHRQSGRGVDAELIERLNRSARGAVSISTNKSTGVARFVRVDKGGDLHPSGRSTVPRGKAIGFFDEYGGLFGVTNATEELALLSTTADKQGNTHLSYQQVHRGVPVFAAVLHVHLDADNDLSAVNGVFVPDIDLDTSPSFAGDQASERAIAEVLANPPESDLTGAVTELSAGELSAIAPRLYVYRDGLIQGVEGPNYLVYEVEVTNGSSVREMVYINAHNGKIVNRISRVHDALYRRLFEQSTANQVWQEGDAFPGILNQDQQNIVNASGDSYYHFLNAFGVDSYDGAGSEMQSVNNDPRINCPNANWNGITTNYCNGVTADDVVAHEWGHAYTDYTHNLIYQWQSGALNESYSDIWGEVVDMLNGAGTDSPGTIRSDNACSVYTTPVPLLTVNNPASIAGDYAAGAASFGPPLSNPGVTGSVVLANDGVGVGSDACTALINGASVSGQVALVDRGACAFTIKVKNAQDAGATGVIVADNVVGPVAGMAGADPTIVIPSLRVTLATGNAIKGELALGVNATLHIIGGAPPENSYRWLMGEDAAAFGSAIRDMWNPVCKSDPGKVSDAQYHCATSDGGGVHTNSGVPNHGFALLVDGGSYNGYTISSIGLVKAAHLYWRAQAVYQTPTTGFDDHADALQASCQDLIGVPLEGLSTTGVPAGPSGQSISAGDCAVVDLMIAAVELRTDPSAQCGFEPILQPNAPALCTNTKNAPVLYRENFDNGLAAWTRTNQGVYSGWPALDWEIAANLPGGRKGSGAYAVNPNAGNCDAGAGDISGMMSLESPVIQIPGAGTLSPHMVTFEHYVATESAWDGGNLKISINGGPYVLVPDSAYRFNPYNATLQPAGAGNTNPLSGQRAFSGTDGGSLFGSWGQSQVDLSLLGVQANDTVRLRYDFGMDGCTGNDGWYVDDIRVTACNARKEQ